MLVKCLHSYINGLYGIAISSVRRIITNEKYVGDLRSGKYYSDNVISHKRKVNYGEKEQYFTSNHHEGIVSRELWNKW